MQSAADRYTISAIVSYHGDARATLIGTAPSRRKARRLGYRKGVQFVPSRFSSATLLLEIRDTATGEAIRSEWASEEAERRYDRLPTVADVGYW